MRQFFSILGILLLGWFSTPAHATGGGSWNQTDITAFNNGEPNGQHTRDHGYKVGGAKCVFDASANTASRTVGAHLCDLKIPKNSYVTKAYYKVVTTAASGSDATIAISISGANDIVSAAAISTNVWNAGGLVLGIPTGSMANEIAVTTDSYPTFTVAVGALTAGKIVLWVEWAYFGDI